MSISIYACREAKLPSVCKLLGFSEGSALTSTQDGREGQIRPCSGPRLCLVIRGQWLFSLLLSSNASQTPCTLEKGNWCMEAPGVLHQQTRGGLQLRPSECCAVVIITCWLNNRRFAQESAVLCVVLRILNTAITVSLHIPRDVKFPLQCFTFLF